MKRPPQSIFSVGLEVAMVDDRSLVAKGELRSCNLDMLLEVTMWSQSRNKETKESDSKAGDENRKTPVEGASVPTCINLNL